MAATIPRLTAIGTQEDLETWWYPLWTEMLRPFTVPGYAAAGGSANLSIGPQAALRNPVGGANPYQFPDFLLFQSVGGIGGAPVVRTLRLVMEVKRRATWAFLFAAQLDCVTYMARAIAAVNFPAPLNIDFLACPGNLWSWRRLTLGGGGWAWAAAWTAPVNQNNPLEFNNGGPINI